MRPQVLIEPGDLSGAPKQKAKRGNESGRKNPKPDFWGGGKTREEGLFLLRLRLGTSRASQNLGLELFKEGEHQQLMHDHTCVPSSCAAFLEALSARVSSENSVNFREVTHKSGPPFSSHTYVTSLIILTPVYGDLEAGGIEPRLPVESHWDGGASLFLKATNPNRNQLDSTRLPRFPSKHHATPRKLLCRVAPEGNAERHQKGKKGTPVAPGFGLSLPRRELLRRCSPARGEMLERAQASGFQDDETG